MSNFAAISWRKQFTFDEMIMMSDRFVLDQHALLDFFSANSLKQQSVNRHVSPHHHDSKPLILLLNGAFLAEKQPIPIL